MSEEKLKSLKPDQVLPLADVHGEYKDWDIYPYKVRVTMSDGKVVDYYKEYIQPKPVLAPQVKRFTEICYGGHKDKEKGRGKRTGNKEE